MKSLHKLLIPGFLQKIDHYLLTHYPVLWSTKVHFWGFYSLIVTNLLAFVWAMSYPLASNQIPDYEYIFQLWVWSFGLSVGVLLYYAYTQSYTVRQVFSFREFITRILTYLFITASLFINTLIVPNLISYRITQLVPLKEFYKDLYALIQDDYRINLSKLTYYNHSYDHIIHDEKRVWDEDNHRWKYISDQRLARFPQYRHLLLESPLNDDRMIDNYVAIFRTLDSLLPKPSEEESQNYYSRKTQLEHLLNKNKKEISERVDIKYWQVYDYLKPYRRKVIRFIRENPDWQQEFKDELILHMNNLEEFIFSLEEDFGYQAPLLLQSEKVIALKKKYVTDYHPQYTKLVDLKKSLGNLYRYYHRDLFFYTDIADFEGDLTSDKFYGGYFISKLKKNAMENDSVQFDPYHGDYSLKGYSKYHHTQDYWEKLYRLTLEQKTEAFTYYLNPATIQATIVHEFPYKVVLPVHFMLETGLILWLMLSLLTLVSHTLSIQRVAQLLALCVTVFVLSYSFFFETWTYSLRYNLGVLSYRPRVYFTQLAPTLLIFMSIIAWLYYYFYPRNHKFSPLMAGLVILSTLLSGFIVFAKQQDIEFSYTHVFGILPLTYEFYLYLILFFCNLMLYWQYLKVHNYPKYNP